MDKKGFTLIEMIVVITVIGVLAAIGIPSLMAYIDKGKASDCGINRKALVLKLEAERAQTPGATMEEIIKKNAEIQCPSGGIYTAIDKDTVKCSHPGHGQDGTIWEEEATHGMDIAEIVPTLTEEEDTSEEIQESTETESDDIEEPTGIAGDRCVPLGAGKKGMGISVKSISDFAKTYHNEYPDSKKVPENVFPKNVLWIYQDEGIYYFNPGNGISITYTDNENSGYSYQINMTGVIPIPTDFSVVTGEEIEKAVKKDSGSITLEKGTIFLSKNEKPYICTADTVIDEKSWNGGVNSGKLNTVTSLKICSP